MDYEMLTGCILLAFATTVRDTTDTDSYSSRAEAVQAILDSYYGYDYEFHIDKAYVPNRHTYAGLSEACQQVFYGGMMIGVVGRVSGDWQAHEFDTMNVEVVPSFGEGVEHLIDVWFNDTPGTN